MRFRSLALALGLLALLLPPQQEARAQYPVAIELVLAIDVSLSVNPWEYELMRNGFAQSFRDERVVEAFDRIGTQGVALAAFQWSDTTQQQVAIEWTLVTSAEEAIAFGDQLAELPRLFRPMGTAVREAIEFAQEMIETSPFEGARRLIDISGDGSDNRSYNPAPARDRAVAAGITINGLAVVNEERYLAGYYRDHVVGGPGAFVEVANDYEAFADAMAAKLFREIIGMGVAEAEPEGRAIQVADAVELRRRPIEQTPP